MTTAQYSRLLPTSDGGSRFDEVSISFELKNFAPPAQPFSVSALGEATQCGFLHLPVGWYGEMHPSPIRMWIFVLQGRMKFEASNGDAREISPGSALLLEDTVGRGHVSSVLSETAVILAVVRLPGTSAEGDVRPGAVLGPSKENALKQRPAGGVPPKLS